MRVNNDILQQDTIGILASAASTRPRLDVAPPQSVGCDVTKAMPALGIDAPQPLDEGIAADDAERTVIVPEGEVLQTRQERSTATRFGLPIPGGTVQAEPGLVVEIAGRLSRSDREKGVAGRRGSGQVNRGGRGSI